MYKNTHEKGSSLITVMIVMSVLLILGISISQLNIAENRFASKHEDDLQAYYIARSGAQALAEYMLRDDSNIAKDLIGKTSNDNGQVGGGTFSVKVEEGESEDIVFITSTGTYNNSERTVTLKVTSTGTGLGGIFDHAIVAKSIVYVANNAGSGIEIDGSVATASSDPNSINLGNHGTADDKVLDPDLIFPAIIFPPDQIPPISYTDELGIINANQTLVSSAAAPKYYHADSINLQNSALTITGDGIIHLYVNGNINLNTNASLTVPSTAQLYLYATGTEVKFLGSGSWHNVFLYAPNAEIEWNNANSGNFYGAIIGNKVKLHNHTKIIHNPDLASNVDLDTSNIGVTYTGYTWVN